MTFSSRYKTAGVQASNVSTLSEACIVNVSGPGADGPARSAASFVDLRTEFESLRFGGPGAERTLQFADPDTKLIGAAALPSQLSPHRLGLGGFAAQPITQLLVL